jgi:uncharacterized protein (TIGR02246 family)
MSSFFKTNIFAVLVAASTTATAAPVPEAAVAAAQLRAINHRYVNAFAVADFDYMKALTASDFLLMDTKGNWVERAQHLDMMRKPSSTNGVSYDDVRVRIFGSIALLHGLFESIDAQGKVHRVRYTDAYHWQGAGWRLIHAQNTLLREGVEKQQKLGVAPAHEPWSGVDPAGDDQEVLHVLNANYVRAFREADVAWYGAHLAPDYVVINSDGSFHDRAAALTEFSKPVFATHIRSFPVDKVRIRRFDDVAFIHAENDYELKDGRKTINRYTDIWQKQKDGSWKCLAAHITTFKKPTL